ncbi:hypothetical protein Ahy_A03g012029 [Arachis hypogaea]|uniref:Uncharacterized protein n=1 Tax=Arachis hypogaea TaxID=3818 RepID=A0A445DSI5_ARAHY|nr:hypothetical protein Ahy_A03g012029 [Arachis hypogaea]
MVATTRGRLENGKQCRRSTSCEGSSFVNAVSIGGRGKVFNTKIKDARAKSIITLLKELQIFIMWTIAKNKTGDNEFEKFEVHGYPTNQVVDLEKKLCTWQFWMVFLVCMHMLHFFGLTSYQKIFVTDD